MFLAGLTAARFGLHLFDLCIIQLFQEGVRRKFSLTDLKKWEKQLGWGGKTGGLFWGWNVPLLRHGSDQVCPGKNQLLDFINFVLVIINYHVDFENSRPQATLTTSLFLRLFSSPPPQNILDILLSCLAPLFSQDSASLSSLSGLYFLYSSVLISKSILYWIILY